MKRKRKTKKAHVFNYYHKKAERLMRVTSRRRQDYAPRYRHVEFRGRFFESPIRADPPRLRELRLHPHLQ